MDRPIIFYVAIIVICFLVVITIRGVSVPSDGSLVQPESRLVGLAYSVGCETIANSLGQNKESADAYLEKYKKTNDVIDYELYLNNLEKAIRNDMALKNCNEVEE